MSSRQRVFVIAAIGGSFWATAFWLCTNTTESVYLTVPVLTLTICLTGLPGFREGVRTVIQQGSLMTAFFLALTVSFASLFFGSPRHLPYLPLSFWTEAAVMLYYFTSMIIVIFCIRRLFLGAGEAMHKRWKFRPAVRLWLCQVLPFALFILLAVPLGLAFTNVHRFKMPNFSDPKQAQDRDFEDVRFVSADGTPLRGWWIPARKPSSRTLIICHGVSANRTLFMPFTEVGDWLEANVFMFDMRGHGASGGHSVTLGCLEKDDALAAIDYVRRERPEQAQEVVGLGISLGAAVLAQAAAEAEPPLDAVILDSCFTSTREMTEAVMRPFPAFCHPWLLSVGLPLADLHAGCAMMAVCPENSIDRLRAPVAFLHSRGDPLIPAEHSERLHQRAALPKQLHIFEEDGHADAFFARKEQYRAAVEALILKTPAARARARATARATASP